jgi:hypothetical protein
VTAEDSIIFLPILSQINWFSQISHSNCLEHVFAHDPYGGAMVAKQRGLGHFRHRGSKEAKHKASHPTPMAGNRARSIVLAARE